MLDAVINLNPDLKRLQDEGFEIEVKDGCAIVHNIPYLDSDGIVNRGVMVSPLEMSGDRVQYKKNTGRHVMYFKGTTPHRKNGEPLRGILHSNSSRQWADVRTDMAFSNKPNGDYADYYDKFTRYIQILSVEAQAVDPTATATTFRRIVSCDDGVFNYSDTNASRAAIMDITDKLRNHKIGIIGLGGTGSYLLDQLAKTPVAEIHLYDGDVFCQHNAFRAPGAPGKDIFELQPFKTDYLKDIYANMHRHIYSHAYYLDTSNVCELESLDFVFLAMDSGASKRIIVDYLRSNKISFIDTGLDINRANDALVGLTRSTLSVDGDTETADQHISYAEADKDLYQSNVQTADLNAIVAIFAVIQWKKQLGFYVDNIRKEQCVYTTNDGELTWD